MGERSRLGCEMTHVVEAGSYLQLFLFCQKTSGLSSPFTVAPNKQLPNREPAKRTACIQQRGLKIQSTSSAKEVAQQQRIEERAGDERFKSGQGGTKPARPCFSTLGG